MALPNIIVKFNNHVATLGTASAFGHVKLTDATDSTSKAADSIGASAYALKQAYDLATEAKSIAQSAKSLGDSAYKYKGSVADLTALNAIANPEVGDVYNIGSSADGANYAWNGTSWDNLGAVIQVDSAINGTSKNPVENQAIKAALDLKSDATHVHQDLKILTAASTYTTYTGGTAQTIDQVYSAANADDAATSTKLTTARTITADLAGTQTHAAFDGTADVYAAVSGVLPIANGGTGAATAAGALENLGLTATAAELNTLDGITADVDELNLLDGVTATTAELNILDGVTADKDEINILDGATISTTELNYLDGVTSSVQDQLDSKATGDHSHSVSITGDGSATAVTISGTTDAALNLTLATVNSDTSATGETTAKQLENGGSFNSVSIQANGKGLVTSNDNVAITLPEVKAGTGITVTEGTGANVGDITITNAGVRSVATGTVGGTVSVNTDGTSADVVVKAIRGQITTPITAATDVTVGSYIKGSGRLLVLIDGVVCAPTTTYVEQGTDGEVSTTIQFVDSIDNSYVVEYRVI